MEIGLTEALAGGGSALVVFSGAVGVFYWKIKNLLLEEMAGLRKDVRQEVGLVKADLRNHENECHARASDTAAHRAADKEWKTNVERTLDELKATKPRGGAG